MDDLTIKTKQFIETFLAGVRNTDVAFRVDLKPNPREGEHDLQPVAITRDGREIQGPMIDHRIVVTASLTGGVEWNPELARQLKQWIDGLPKKK